jgi:hypothetical protein
MYGDNHRGLHLRLHQWWHLRTSALSYSDRPSLPQGQGVTTHRLAHKYDRGPISRPLVPCSHPSSHHAPTSHSNQSRSGTLASRMCQRVHTASRRHQQCCRPRLAQWGCSGGGFTAVAFLFHPVPVGPLRIAVIPPQRTFPKSGVPE